MKKIDNFKLSRQGDCLQLQILGTTPQVIDFHSTFRVNKGMPIGAISEDDEQRLYIKKGGYIFAGPRLVDEVVCLEKHVLFRRGECWYSQSYLAQYVCVLGHRFTLRGFDKDVDRVFYRIDSESQKTIISVTHDEIIRHYEVESSEVVSDLWNEDFVLVNNPGQDGYRLFNNHGVLSMQRKRTFRVDRQGDLGHYMLKCGGGKLEMLAD